MTDEAKGGTSRKKWVLGTAVALAAAALIMLVVLPAERGIDPTGFGAATGLIKIAVPDQPELERGMLRTGVLALSETAPEPAPGVQDTWEYELAPFEAVEFKYTIAEGQMVAFRWEGTGELHYDMHAHPFEGGTDLTESYSIADARRLQGTYTPAFTGEHGWFWENRSMESVTLRLEASGAMQSSTVYVTGGSSVRPIEGVQDTVEGAAQGHSMQGS